MCVTLAASANEFAASGVFVQYGVMRHTWCPYIGLSIALLEAMVWPVWTREIGHWHTTVMSLP